MAIPLKKEKPKSLKRDGGDGEEVVETSDVDPDTFLFEDDDDDDDDSDLPPERESSDDDDDDW